jgi:hypothetical protein
MFESVDRYPRSGWNSYSQCSWQVGIQAFQRCVQVPVPSLALAIMNDHGVVLLTRLWLAGCEADMSEME